MSEEHDQLDEECGVFGIWAPGLEVARLTYFALMTLQHRGQESAGIAVGNGTTVIQRKDTGLVTQVFSDSDLTALTGKAAIGHVRYATSGARSWEEAQPHFSMIDDVVFALAHNGTLVNTAQVRSELEAEGVQLRSDSDSEVATKYIGLMTQRTKHMREGIRHMMRRLEGGYAMALIRENALYAFRDPHAIRPLVLGEIAVDKSRGWVVASETCALDVVGARFVREVAPGEIVRMSDDGLVSEQGVARLSEHRCIFEHVYFSRPDSVEQGRSMYAMRFAMGRALASEAPAEVDLVIGVPDSGLPPAEGYAAGLGVRFGEGFIKNRYVARTFIEPTQEMRERGVRMKLNALHDSVAGKRIAVVDDSIVRGTTMRQIVGMLREAGAVQVHVRIMCPEVKWPCFYGIDTSTQDQLISAQRNSDQVCAFIGADSLAFLSLPGLLSCVPKGGYCTACYTGRYPVAVPPEASSGHFLPDSAPVFLDGGHAS
ncbi:MAG: amidophosphoribosyltransferase [Coriobacteriales bacterium]|nr:amidophosphoribosyltransferase [Coriobacteriales bacterium]